MALSVRLTRSVRFSAAHRLRRADWDEARNRAAFGDDAILHGHNYVLEATVAGEVDAVTGQVADPRPLEAALTALATRLGWRELDPGLPGLDGGPPTAENLALLAYRELAPGVGARLVRVRVYESPERWAEVAAAGGDLQ